ncbi:PQQ-dependent sugar dehydrogenase [Flavobacterium rakeshii]|uniref:PQQ-dependent sugar dehydrogenase n=1 Tax=Flavobacterium rakeshii TaxID=1038845 RepID=UPI002E7B7DF5|nr:PQQ-dependent sugar dehydrogenase [Flavobacterium rakeshii]MEE1897489.1 PQQ-dependent sugar dehydrogenase [Flavobacterium rakeshii]
MRTLFTFVVCLCTGAAFSQAQPELEMYATGFNSPVVITNAGDERIFIAEQGGLIRFIDDVNPDATIFLDISDLISTGGERGLLGLAFHPDYATNGYFYVNYTNGDGTTVISRFTVSDADENAADPDSEVMMINVPQPFSNHNGGCLQFGPDGYLYIAMGDGGSGGDPNNYAQNLESYLGKLLRIDVQDDGSYDIPGDNPFAGTSNVEEIWAYGLRNPWKFSFDSATGDLWIADVGQNAIEEINKVDGTSAGLNYGWRCYEGSDEYDMSECAGVTGTVMPYAQYTHSETGGCSITGGYVYRGTMYPGMQGMYFYADYCSNVVSSIDPEGNIEEVETVGGSNFTTFGEDANGELYITGMSGIIYHIKDANLGLEDVNGSQFAIYPNPASQNLFIKNNTVNTPLERAHIYDTSGKVLLNKPLENIELNSLDISGLSNGLYILALTDANGSKYNYKLAVK